MKPGEKGESTGGPVRRIVVDKTLAPPTETPGRRLDELPTAGHRSPVRPARGKAPIRTSYLVAGGGATLVLMAVLAVFFLQKPRTVTPRVKLPQTGEKRAESQVPQTQSQDVLPLEADAKQVIRRISRDNKPYSFTESSIREISDRVKILSRSPHLVGCINRLQVGGDALGSRIVKEGLQPSLVMLVAMAVSKGGEAGDCVTTTTRILPVLSLLNKTFGSSEADASLILIAAFSEGPGSRRTHPLLRRMSRVSNSPLTERNVWHFHDQNVLSDNAYQLVIDTIAFGVIMRNPRQFGLEIDPVSL